MYRLASTRQRYKIGPDRVTAGQGSADSGRWSGCVVSGSGLSEWVCAESAGEWSGGQLLDPSFGVSDCVAGGVCHDFGASGLGEAPREEGRRGVEGGLGRDGADDARAMSGRVGTRSVTATMNMATQRGIGRHSSNGIRPRIPTIAVPIVAQMTAPNMPTRRALLCK